MAKVFNVREWGIGEWGAALGVVWVVYQAVKENERTARALDDALPDLLVLPDGRVVVRGEDV